MTDDPTVRLQARLLHAFAEEDLDVEPEVIIDLATSLAAGDTRDLATVARDTARRVAGDSPEAWMRRKFGSTPSEHQNGDPLAVTEGDRIDEQPLGSADDWMRSRTDPQQRRH